MPSVSQTTLEPTNRTSCLFYKVSFPRDRTGERESPACRRQKATGCRISVSGLALFLKESQNRGNLPLVGQIRKRPSVPLPGVKFPRIQGVAWTLCCRTNAEGESGAKTVGAGTPEEASRRWWLFLPCLCRISLIPRSGNKKAVLRLAGTRGDSVCLVAIPLPTPTAAGSSITWGCLLIRHKML